MAESNIILSDKSSVNVLNSEYHDLVARALRNTLSTEIAQSTFAQIVDGLPLLSVLEDTHAGLDPEPEPDHPLFTHESLCPGALEKTREILRIFDIENLKFDTSLLHALQAHQTGSDSFNTRLIEFIAVAAHEVAKYLYKLDSKGHQDDDLPPTFFKHAYYFDYEQYPDGVVDMVGYWAESRILGGVILFDRKTEPASDAVFIHPDREEATYRICELTGEQKTSLVRFLLAPLSENLRCPLPIASGAENTHRIDPEEPISWTGIYRDAWERELHTEELGDGRGRDVWSKSSELDWLTFEAWQEARARYNSRFERYSE
ncbi:hypothetical protein Daus18300_000498 [Diaporthe australafricana]|uniref:Uncharacterized protein n=1 Tax=Diaporthe australafricana TaxID=127596 RepID=A0ABR3Y4J6_9PEZI